VAPKGKRELDRLSTQLVKTYRRQARKANRERKEIPLRDRKVCANLAKAKSLETRSTTWLGVFNL
jgi:hypothetical protein